MTLDNLNFPFSKKWEKFTMSNFLRSSERVGKLFLVSKWYSPKKFDGSNKKFVWLGNNGLRVSKKNIS